VAVDPTGSVTYFAGGASLPAGKYRIEYLDGCLEWGPQSGGYDWTVNYQVGPLTYYLELVGSSPGDVVADLPGTIASAFPMGDPTTTGTDYTTCASCVAANRAMDAPLDFTFGGGPLGLLNSDPTPGDDVGCETTGSGGPVYPLTFLGDCL
jgi:hypothetical protein